MSRSRKRTPVVAWSGAESDRRFKQIEHRRERAAVHDALHNDRDLPSSRRYGDPVAGPKDGKVYAPNLPKVLRK